MLICKRRNGLLDTIMGLTVFLKTLLLNQDTKTYRLLGTDELAQVIKYLLDKPEYPSLGRRHPCKSQPQQHMPEILGRGGWEEQDP